MMYFYHLLVVCVLRVTFVSASYVPNIGVDGCLSCGPGDPQNAELEDFLKTQKVAQRLQSIKQQLDNSLRIQRQPKNAPKLKALPQFLVDQLMESNGNDADKETHKNTVEMRQVVLFPDEGKLFV
ncbi:hypothetical protein V9T40_008879 [Parthenolecanium corni]|uniref:Uncharacterized protein n=1 Tax=Parthenolecanium corni TaxID=536013 RepID=A0AAN9TNX3_9HEMI